MTALTVPEVLRRAAQVIDQRGLHKGWYVPSGTTAAFRAWEAAQKALAGALPAGRTWLGVDDWNDYPATTAEQVKATLLVAAERAQVVPDAT